MWSALLALALSGAWAETSDVDLEDVTPWQQAAQDMLDGPAGCWDVVGRASWDYRVARFAEYRGTAVFVGRLVDGEWRDFVVEPLGEEVRRGRRGVAERLYLSERRFAPLIGRTKQMSQVSVGSDGDTQVTNSSDEGADNLLRSFVDDLSGDVETSWLERDEETDTIVLHSVVALDEVGGKPDAEMVTYFPQGRLAPTELEVLFPKAMRMSSVPPVTVRNARVQLRAQPGRTAVFPSMEAFSFRATMLGFQLDGAQTITYRHALPCGGSLAAE